MVTTENTTSPNEPEDTPLFSPDDLAMLENPMGGPLSFRAATKLLVGMANKPREYGNPAFPYGRFEICEGSRTAYSTRATLRICRQALDFLEADYLACEEAEMQHLRGQLEAFEQLRGQTA